MFGGVAVVMVAAGAYALLATTHLAPAQAGFDAAATSLTAVAVVGDGDDARAGRARRPVTAPAHAPDAGVRARERWRRARAAARRGSRRSGAAPVAPPLLAALLALVLGVASALGWLRLWLAPRPGAATAVRDAALLDALLSTVVPEGQGLDLAANDPEVRARIARAFAARSSARRPLLRIVLRALDALAYLRHRRSFAQLDQDTRETLYAGLATSRSARLRAVGALLDEIVLGTFYGDARVRTALSDDASWLAARIDAGPNAEAHRVRQEAAARAATAAQLAEQEAVVEQRARIAADVAELAADVSESTGEPEPAAATDPPGAEAAPAGAVLRAAEAGAAEEVPFERAWTLGAAREPGAPAAGTPALREARAGGPTRP